MQISHLKRNAANRIRVFSVLLCAFLALALAHGAEPGKSGKGGPRVDPAKRAEAVKRLCEHLGVGTGKTIADVGCGNGADTMTFAEIVGPSGKVYGEEIEQKPLDAMMQKAKDRQLNHVLPVLGVTEDPKLPEGALDLIYMHQVFHHFAKPLDMLSHFWRNLRPGGCLVIIDRQKGPQREWIDLAQREKKHFWIGETTVVRQARESGFRFESSLDDLWADKDHFVLVFRKPKDLKKPNGDPDLPLALKGKSVVSALPELARNSPAVLFLGIDQGREVLPALQQLKSKPHIYDVMLEEWTTVKNELPKGLSADANNILRTTNGQLPSVTGKFQAALFADGYSRLWDPAPLLQQLRQSLATDGYVAILDRNGPENEPRHPAGHNRRIGAGLVKADMEHAGFELVKELKAPAKDRFYLLFKARPGAN